MPDKNTRHKKHAEQVTRRKLSKVEKIAIPVIILIAIWAAYSFTQPSPAPTPQSSSLQDLASSTNRPLFSASNFVLVASSSCGYDVNGTKFVSADWYLQNNESVPFQFLSAKIFLANYTLANGTVVAINEQWTDANQTFAVIHDFKFLRYLYVMNSGPKITNVEFVITADVQGLPQPIIFPVSVHGKGNGAGGCSNW